MTTFCFCERLQMLNNSLFNLYADKKKTTLQDQQNVVTVAEEPFSVCLKLSCSYIMVTNNFYVMCIITVTKSNMNIRSANIAKS